MRKYIFILSVLSIISIIIILYLYTKEKETFDNDKYISIDEFNNKFDSNIITLPKSMFAAGVINNKWYIYVDEPEKDNLFKLYEFHYIKTYIHPLMNKSTYYYIMYFWDGYREDTPFTHGELIEYIPYKDQYNNDYNPPFKNEFPILHKNRHIFAYCKHLNDHNTVLLPDYFYISNHGYKEKQLKEIDNNYIHFDNKMNKCIWRGKLNNGSYHNFISDNKHKLNQRSYFKMLYEEDNFNHVQYEDIFTSIAEQIKYKYILDIDGVSNTWDATVWKLYSGSVLLKTKSIWKQWYYDELKEYVHYVPVENDFSDLNNQIEWCIQNDEKCKEITKNAKQFVLNKLNWDQVIKDTASTMNKYV
jgi:hypothetical protein